ncbi:MAG: metalloprotease TldD [Deltaproteobacteria bacterium]|nr:metalloprotease TldD [Deltaproteobacteria bacterium]
MADNENAAPLASREGALEFFRERYGLDNQSLTDTLGVALERQVDYADIYFEHSSLDSVSLEEGIVKSGSRHLEQGVGVRALSGERQGYAHSDEISLESARLAAGTARAISADTGASHKISVAGQTGHDLYPMEQSSSELPVEEKISFLSELDSYARRKDSCVEQVMASVITHNRKILVCSSDGILAADMQPLVRLNVQVIAADGSRREVGYEGRGGRHELQRMMEPQVWQEMVDEAIRVARLNLSSVPCPAGSMTVVLGPGWPGILLHEAIGHGLEGDFNRKKTSAFSDRIGQRVAAPGVTVVDDGTLPERRGSINFDDEGTPSQRNTLIEDGILVGYLHDKLNARLMGTEPTGNGRRESYAHVPLPRMTNTFMLGGEDDPEEILKSVKKGLYAVSFGGGQVDITSGKFVFSASEAYLIEDGQIGAPVKGATLIGNGPDVLTRVDRIGNDLALDRGVGTCGKDGQGVPVGVGLPTIRVNDLTVGGTEG